MITQPSTDLLHALVQEEMERASSLDDAGRRELAALSEGLLGVVARRVANQDGWMSSEIEQILRLLGFLAEQGIITSAPTTTHPGDTSDLGAQYRDLSAALATAVAPAMRAGGEARRRLDQVIAERVAHERSIRGDLTIVRG